ncbi:RNA polymerase sigma factor [Pedobacter nutrimenti]|uniref:RNA polymerase sigma factor n=1 Tax=Pedobacter nutrimenti TaxID=1241337 RepID=UPI0010E7DFEC|nr:RNA polymerase sigma factor [Pedobacter nutrimenti]
MGLKIIPDENTLIEKVAEGDQQAFTVLFRKHHGIVYRFALKLTRSETLAEEVVQDIFMKIWLKRTELSEIENFGAFLNRITRNHTYNLLKRLTMEAVVNKNLKAEFIESTENTQESIDYNASAEILKRAVDLLSPQQKKVYLLCHVEGLKYEEAAKKLNISAGTVHSHMKQALHSIRAHFKNSDALIFLLLYLYK